MPITRKQFLALSHDDQEEWIIANIPDYEILLYGDGYLGCSYPIVGFDFEAYQSYADSYDTAGLIQSECPEVAEARATEINSGAELTEKERNCLLAAVANGDPEGWTGHHGFSVRMKGGTVFVHFTSENIGQGGASFSYQSAYKSRKNLIADLKGEFALALERPPRRALPKLLWIPAIIFITLALIVWSLFALMGYPLDAEWEAHCAVNYPDISYDECRRISGEGAR